MISFNNDSLAIDIVLLPPSEIMDRIIESTKHLDNSPTRLNQADCLPHLSLAMGVLKHEDITPAVKTLEKLAGDSQPQKITVLKTNYFPTPDSKLLSELVLEASPGLIDIHLAAMKTFKPFIDSHDVSPDMFFPTPPVASISTYWVKHYYDKQSPEDFYPHITLGEGKAKPLTEPYDFIANRLALCHLGTYCTCRKIIAEFSLQ